MQLDENTSVGLWTARASFRSKVPSDYPESSVLNRPGVVSVALASRLRRFKRFSVLKNRDSWHGLTITFESQRINAAAAVRTAMAVISGVPGLPHVVLTIRIVFGKAWKNIDL